MRKLVLPVMLGALTLPAPAVAQANVDDAVAALGDLSHQLRDPERQREMKLMMQAMTEVLLDMPIAPLALWVAQLVAQIAKCRHCIINISLRNGRCGQRKRTEHHGKYEFAHERPRRNVRFGERSRRRAVTFV